MLLGTVILVTFVKRLLMLAIVAKHHVAKYSLLKLLLAEQLYIRWVLYCPAAWS